MLDQERLYNDFKRNLGDSVQCVHVPKSGGVSRFYLKKKRDRLIYLKGRNFRQKKFSRNLFSRIWSLFSKLNSDRLSLSFPRKLRFPLFFWGFLRQEISQFAKLNTSNTAPLKNAPIRSAFREPSSTLRWQLLIKILNLFQYLPFWAQCVLLVSCL